MPELHHSGVYIEEVPVGAHSIEGVATSTTGFVGFAQRGPFNIPTVVASTSEFIATFGSVDVSQPLSLAVESFFLNGGKRAIIVRVGADDQHEQQSGDIIGQAEKNTGLHALHLCKERIGLLLTPDVAFMATDEAAHVSAATVAFAEVFGIFHICDVPNSAAGLGPDAVLSWAKSTAPRSRNVAIYYPWLNMADGSGKADQASRQPPAAIAAGVYARTDEGRGVWKSPAGTDAAVIGATGITVQLNDAIMEKLANVLINAIREIPGGAIVLWGARTRDRIGIEALARRLQVERANLAKVLSGTRQLNKKLVAKFEVARLGAL